MSVGCAIAPAGYRRVAPGASRFPLAVIIYTIQGILAFSL